MKAFSPISNILLTAELTRLRLKRESVLFLIRSLNPNKATESDEIFSQMFLICNASVVSPLMIIFKHILETSSYPDPWKLANVVSIYRKENKQLVENYQPISLLPICRKIFEKLVFRLVCTHI